MFSCIGLDGKFVRFIYIQTHLTRNARTFRSTQYINIRSPIINNKYRKKFLILKITEFQTVRCPQLSVKKFGTLPEKFRTDGPLHFVAHTLLS